MPDLPTLKAAQAAALANPAMAPQKDAAGNVVKTFCNFAAQLVAKAMGCDELDNLMADDQFSVMIANASGRWKRVSGQEAASWAMAGGLAFAAASSAMLKEAHGHIASISPEPCQFSGSLDTYVPMLCNVGMTDADEKTSLAFPVADGEPDYFTWA